jgi:putative transposase
MTDRRQTKTYDLWARLRFSVIGHLLADPPANGTLGTEIAKLAEREWRHPVTGQPVRFGRSTIERGLYLSRRERQDPVGVHHERHVVR